ncbi:MAG: ATP-grasp domain-containing protein [Acidobacteriota bacterium]
MPHAVLVTSIGAKVPLLEAVRDALRRLHPTGRLIGADSDDRVVGRWFVDGFWPMPPLDELAPSMLAEFCRRHAVGWIVPTRDAELPVLATWAAQQRDQLPPVLAPPREAAELCLDKLRFAEELGELAAVPAWLSPPPELPACFPEDRWVVKERFGAGSRRLTLDVSREEAVRAGHTFEAPIFQPFIRGVEYSADLYISRVGEAWGCVVRRRDLVRDGESQVTTIVRRPGIEELVLEAARRLGLRGCAVFQVLEDRHGGLHLLECNPRFGGASTLSLAAGLDVFYWFFRETTEPGFRPGNFVRGRPGLRLVRYKRDRILEPERAAPAATEENRS